MSLLSRTIRLAYFKPEIRPHLLPILRKVAGSYYTYRGERLQEVIRRWQEEGQKLYGPDKIQHKKNSMYAHGLFPVQELWPYREYTWSKFDARRTPKEWDSLLASIKEEGLREPLHFQVGRGGNAKVAEGNHRLAIARQLGMKELPVKFHFYEEVSMSAKPDPKPKPVKAPPKVEKEIEKLVEHERTPEEKEELSRAVNEIFENFWYS